MELTAPPTTGIPLWAKEADFPAKVLGAVAVTRVYQVQKKSYKLKA